jgi:hypothetical protein
MRLAQKLPICLVKGDQIIPIIVETGAICLTLYFHIATSLALALICEGVPSKTSTDEAESGTRCRASVQLVHRETFSERSSRLLLWLCVAWRSRRAK